MSKRNIQLEDRMDNWEAIHLWRADCQSYEYLGLVHSFLVLKFEIYLTKESYLFIYFTYYSFYKTLNKSKTQATIM